MMLTLREIIKVCDGTFIGDESDLDRPIAADAIIGLSVKPRPTNAPAAIGMHTAL